MLDARDDTRRAIIRNHQGLPEGIRYPEASEGQLIVFENEFGKIPDLFRWYLLNCGGGVVGSEWVDGIKNLPDTHREFNRERATGFWPLMNDVFVIGRDKGGNYFGIHQPSGRLVLEDHDFGGLHEIAPSLEHFLVCGLIGDNDQ